MTLSASQLESSGEAPRILQDIRDLKDLILYTTVQVEVEKDADELRFRTVEAGKVKRKELDTKLF